jgi:glutathione S-transferase
MALTLYIGNKNYSSWSLRPWIALKAAGIAFEEKMIALRSPSTAADIAKIAPNGKVPVLHDDGVIITESLSILEYAAELAPEALLWPQDRQARAIARSLANEMHAGFAPLRNHCQMNIRRVDTPRPLPTPDDVKANCARIEQIWTQCLTTYGQGGPFLFGHFTNADAMFAPVATRFKSYALPRGKVADAYIEAIYSHPAFIEWSSAAAKEALFSPDDMTA